MVLSHIHNKVRALRALLPGNMRSSLRASRRFMCDIDPITYRFSWISAVWSGIAGLGMYAALGVFFRDKWQGLFQSYIKSGQLSLVMIVGVVAAIACYKISKSVIQAMGHWRESIVRDKVQLKIEQEDMALLLTLDAGRLTDPDFIRLRGRASGRHGSHSMEELFEIQVRLVRGLFGLGASLGLLAVINPVFIPLIALPVIFEIVKDIREDSSERGRYGYQHIIDRKMKIYTECLTDVPLLFQGKLFRFTDYWQERYYSLRNDKWRSMLQQRKLELRWNLVTSVMGVVPLIAIAVYLARELVNGSMPFSDVFFLWGAMSTLGDSFGSISYQVVRLRNECIDYGYREEFLATKPLIDESGAERFRFGTTPRLEFKNVSFRYPQQETLVLNGIDLVIAPGEKVALVGENGSGKTTILRLLAKMYLPDEGAVMIDGLPSSRITQSCWFEQMLYATQETEVPEFTIEEALTGTFPGTADKARLAQAAKHSRIGAVIEQLPDKYGTQIGVHWSAGCDGSILSAARTRRAHRSL
jgi:ATP-binding cassette subfamily B protein